MRVLRYRCPGSSIIICVYPGYLHAYMHINNIMLEVDAGRAGLEISKRVLVVPTESGSARRRLPGYWSCVNEEHDIWGQDGQLRGSAGQGGPGPGRGAGRGGAGRGSRSAIPDRPN